MKRFLSAVLATVLASGLNNPSRAADEEPNAILEKAINALGGAAKLAKAGTATWKVKGKIHFNDIENDFSSQATVQGLDHYRSEFDGEFGGNPVHGLTIVNGNKGWRKFSDMITEMDDDAIANEKRSIYLQIIPAMLIPLKDKGFKIQTAPEEKIGGRSASVLKVTPPDGKDFTLYFDKESRLPVKLVAKVVGFQGDEFTQETTFSSYKEFAGIKKATRVDSKRDGEQFVEVEITEYKAVDTLAPDTFAEPK
jgi:hypothetical protein